MDFSQLKNYLSEQAEIKRLAMKIDDPEAWKEYYAHSTILDYRRGYPKPQMISGIDMDAYNKARQRWVRRKEMLEIRARETEDYIDEIQDSRTRQVFTMYFLDGYAEKTIGKILHVDRSTISRIIWNQLGRE